MNNKTAVSAFSRFTLSTSTNGQCNQRIKKLQIVILSSYEEPFEAVRTRPQICSFSHNWMFVSSEIKKNWFAAWISRFINQLIHIHFIPFSMNIRKKNLDEPAIFLCFYNSFLGETPRNTHQKTIAIPRFSHDTVSH